MVKKLIAGNWKMNGMPSNISEVKAINTEIKTQAFSCDLLLCLPAPLIMQYSAHADESLMIGGQDCHEKQSGAHTGDISAELLKAAGAGAVIVGHSERRSDHGESSAIVAKKALAAQSAGLLPIICIGETLEERDAGKALEIVTGQLKDSMQGDVVKGAYVIAYEPIWAIGTGRVPENKDIEEMHAALRKTLQQIDPVNGESRQILYGGSVKPSNAAEILNIENVNGALVGGASLKAVDFVAIARSV